MDPATAIGIVKGVNSAFGASGALGGGAKVPDLNSSSPFNSSGSVYSLTSGNTASSPLIGGFGSISNIQLLIVGGVALIGILFWKKIL